jgi:hypothetical protein
MTSHQRELVEGSLRAQMLSTPLADPEKAPCEYVDLGMGEALAVRLVSTHGDPD